MVALTSTCSEIIRFDKLGVVIRVNRTDRQTTLVEVTMSDALFEDESATNRWLSHSPNTESMEAASKHRHAIRNRLQSASLSLDVLQRCSAEDPASDVERILEIAVESLTELESMAI
ncbi:hypothetical protein [Novipirellula caenicola]|uniref:Uncharacterized protein n=1 Tax=Novipirellula caenicola TaxID=1536901 RepID=A0ABP9W0P2_9BACT